MSEEKLKVCYYVLDLPFLGNNVGGAETQLYLIGKELLNYGWEPHYLTESLKFKGEKEIDGLFVHRLSSHKDSLFHYGIMGLNVILNAFAWNNNILYSPLLSKLSADIYHQRGAGLITGYVANCAKNKKKPFVFSIAFIDDCTLRGITWRGNPIKVRARRRLYLLGIKYASVVIASAEYLKEEFLKNFPDKDVRIIPSGHMIPKEINKKRKPIIVWAGRLVDYKHPELIIELAKKLPNYEFVVLGRVQHHSMHWVVNCGLPNIEFRGFVDLDEVNKTISEARVFIDTSEAAGFPNTFIQSWLRGTPTISLSVDPDCVICKYKLGFHSKNINQMVEDIKELMENNHLWNKMSKNAYNYSIKNHDIKEVGKKHHELYMEMIK